MSGAAPLGDVHNIFIEYDDIPIGDHLRPGAVIFYKGEPVTVESRAHCHPETPVLRYPDSRRYCLVHGFLDDNDKHRD